MHRVHKDFPPNGSSTDIVGNQHPAAKVAVERKNTCHGANPVCDVRLKGTQGKAPHSDTSHGTTNILEYLREVQWESGSEGESGARHSPSKEGEGVPVKGHGDVEVNSEREDWQPEDDSLPSARESPGSRGEARNPVTKSEHGWLAGFRPPAIPSDRNKRRVESPSKGWRNHTPLYTRQASVQAQQRAGLRLPQDVIDASNGVQERKPVSRQPASTLRILQRPPHNQGRQSGTYMQRLQPQHPYPVAVEGRRPMADDPVFGRGANRFPGIPPQAQPYRQYQQQREKSKRARRKQKHQEHFAVQPVQGHPHPPVQWHYTQGGNYYPPLRGWHPQGGHPVAHHP